MPTGGRRVCDVSAEVFRRPVPSVVIDPLLSEDPVPRSDLVVVVRELDHRVTLVGHAVLIDDDATVGGHTVDDVDPSVESLVDRPRRICVTQERPSSRELSKMEFILCWRWSVATVPAGGVRDAGVEVGSHGTIIRPPVVVRNGGDVVFCVSRDRLVFLPIAEAGDLNVHSTFG